jgi:hypothetical protein
MEMAERTIDRPELGFSAFVDAANKSVSMSPSPATDLSLKALSIGGERNVRAAFEHARKLLHAKDVQHAMRIQAEFLSSVRSRDRAAERSTVVCRKTPVVVGRDGTARAMNREQ